MTWVALTLVLAAEVDDRAPPPEREHRVVLSNAVLAVVPAGGLGPLPLSFEAKVDFEVIRPLRVFVITYVESLNGIRGVVRAGGVAGPFALSGLAGAEGIVTPILPVELSFGGAAGLTVFTPCGPSFCAGNQLQQWRLQLRAFIGYRFNAWVSAGFLATGNVLIGFPFPPWLGTGAQLSVRL